MVTPIDESTIRRVLEACDPNDDYFHTISRFERAVATAVAALVPNVDSDTKCPGKLGDRPWWMSPDQYDASGGQCACILPRGHDGPHACEHTVNKP